MIRTPDEKEVASMKINVLLKNGQEFLNKDLTEEPITDKERFVGFWDGDKIKVYPTSEIARIEYTFNT